MGRTGITVVTTRSWVGRELAANTAHPVTSSFGLDAPRPEMATPGSAWWMPAEHAARLLHQQLPLTLSAPGPHWLPDLPVEFSGRRVCAVSPADLLMRSDGFSKPAEAKIERFPAQWRTGEQAAADLASAQLPADAVMQWTSARLDLSEEWRCYVVDGRITTYSLYLTTSEDGTQITYYDGASCDPDLGESAAAFAATVAADLAASNAAPPAYCLDVGYDRISGRFLVIEANPSWCSAWYGGDLDAVAEAIVRSCQPLTGELSRWAWRPDAYLTARAARMRPLPTPLTT